MQSRYNIDMIFDKDIEEEFFELNAFILPPHGFQPVVNMFIHSTRDISYEHFNRMCAPIQGISSPNQICNILGFVFNISKIDLLSSEPINRKLLKHCLFNVPVDADSGSKITNECFIKRSGKSSAILEYSSTLKELNENLDKSWSFGISIPIQNPLTLGGGNSAPTFGPQIKKSSSFSHNKMENSSTLRFIQSNYNKILAFNYTDFGSDYLDTHGEYFMALKKLPDLKNPGLIKSEKENIAYWRAYDDFIENFGTHVVTELLIGAKLEIWVEQQGSDISNSEATSLSKYVSGDTTDNTTTAAVNLLNAGNVHSRSVADRETMSKSLVRIFPTGGTLESRNLITSQLSRLQLSPETRNVSDIDINQLTDFMASGNTANLDTPASYIFTPVWTVMMQIMSYRLQRIHTYVNKHPDAEDIPKQIKKVRATVKLLQKLINLNAAYSRQNICQFKQANFVDLSRSGNPVEVKQYLTHYVKHDFLFNPKHDESGGLIERGIPMTIYQKIKWSEQTITIYVVGEVFTLNTFVCWNEKTGCHGNQDCNWNIGGGGDACLASVGNSIEKSNEIGRKLTTKTGEIITIYKSQQMKKKNPIRGKGINPSCQRTNITGTGTAFSDFGCKCVNNDSNKDWINSPEYLEERNTWIQVEDPLFVIPSLKGYEIRMV